MDPSQGQNAQSDSFVPFTKAERMEQLAKIDKDIVSMLRSVGTAVQCLGDKESQRAKDEDKPMGNSDEEESQIFTDSMNEFISTLRSVNTSMKRQIWGLEEAGIISLQKKDGDSQPNTTVASKEQPSLEPDGHGKIGGMDVGWLNSRSGKVESDMESELWDQAEGCLRRLMERNGSGNDQHMSS